MFLLFRKYTDPNYGDLKKSKKADKACYSMNIYSIYA